MNKLSVAHLISLSTLLWVISVGLAAVVTGLPLRAGSPTLIEFILSVTSLSTFLGGVASAWNAAFVPRKRI